MQHSMTPPCRYLFVYGTLLQRSPHPMARFLAERGQLLGEAKIMGRLYDLGRFPGLVSGEPAEWVYGDLYDLGERASVTIAELDRYENDESTAAALFERQLADVVYADGTPTQAWVYWFRGEVNDKSRIASGRYF
jgi:gamma-glutamylcyclotransferase (GGCT)/AIG2-like uncharacterized protein YtfP